MDPIARARLSLVGLSVGDAFGETFFAHRAEVVEMAEARRPAPGPWRWTDDTAMAISIVEELAQHGAIDPERLAARFAARYRQEPWRGYGAGAHRLLESLLRGEPWQRAATSLFGGTGSYGNGAAMRVAPLGAYFADDLDAVVGQATRSAEVTHAHPEGVAGAVAVAIAAAIAWRTRGEPWGPPAFLRAVTELTPESETRRGIEAAIALPDGTTPEEAADVLGSGQPGQRTGHRAVRAVVRGPEPGRLRGHAVDHRTRARGRGHHVCHRWRHHGDAFRECAYPGVVDDGYRGAGVGPGECSGRHLERRAGRAGLQRGDTLTDSETPGRQEAKGVSGSASAGRPGPDTRRAARARKEHVRTRPSRLVRPDRCARRGRDRSDQVVVGGSRVGLLRDDRDQADRAERTHGARPQRASRGHRLRAPSRTRAHPNGDRAARWHPATAVSFGPGWIVDRLVHEPRGRMARDRRPDGS